MSITKELCEKYGEGTFKQIFGRLEDWDIKFHEDTYEDDMLVHKFKTDTEVNMTYALGFEKILCKT